MREEQNLALLENTAQGFIGTEYSKPLDGHDYTIGVKVVDGDLVYTVQTRKDGAVDRKPVTRAQALKLLAKAGY